MQALGFGLGLGLRLRLGLGLGLGLVLGLKLGLGLVLGLRLGLALVLGDGSDSPDCAVQCCSSRNSIMKLVQKKNNPNPQLPLKYGMWAWSSVLNLLTLNIFPNHQYKNNT